MDIDKITKDGITALINQYKKAYNKNLAILTAPLGFNPEPIDENYHKLLKFYKGVDIFDLEGKDNVESVNKIIGIIEAKKAAGISIGYIMPHILYVIELLSEIYSDIVKIDIDKLD